MYGALIAFKEYDPFVGFAGSPWVGLKNFREFMRNPMFTNILRNTIVISLLKLAFGGPAPLILALMINEIGSRKFKRITQTISYLPHFLSWVIVYGIFFLLLSENVGLVNNLRLMIGLPKMTFLANRDAFYPIIVTSSVWKSIGWGSIIYLAAITSIPPDIYESAVMDGASRWQQTLYITIPQVLPVFAIMTILALGNILNEDFEQLFLFMGGTEQLMLTDVGEVFETYVFRVGFFGMIYTGPRFSYSAAVGFFKSAFGMVLVIAANWFAKRKLNYRGVF